MVGLPRIVCKECRWLLPESDFYASNRARCKECVKKGVRANRAAKVEYYRAYDRKRYRTDPDRREHCQAMGKKVPMSVLVQKQRERRLAEPEKFKARNAVSNALRSGKIKREPCFFCGSVERIHAHHDDYSRPLDVIWLCSSCHGKLHAIQGDFRKDARA